MNHKLHNNLNKHAHKVGKWLVILNMINHEHTRTSSGITSLCFSCVSPACGPTLTLPRLLSCTFSTGPAAGGPRAPRRPGFKKCFNFSLLLGSCIRFQGNFRVYLPI